MLGCRQEEHFLTEVTRKVSHGRSFERAWLKVHTVLQSKLELVPFLDLETSSILAYFSYGVVTNAFI